MMASIVKRHGVHQLRVKGNRTRKNPVMIIKKKTRDKKEKENPAGPSRNTFGSLRMVDSLFVFVISRVVVDDGELGDEYWMKSAPRRRPRRHRQPAKGQLDRGIEAGPVTALSIAFIMDQALVEADPVRVRTHSRSRYSKKKWRTVWSCLVLSVFKVSICLIVVNWYVSCRQTCNTRKKNQFLGTTRIHSFYIGDAAFEHAAMSSNDLVQMNRIAVKLSTVWVQDPIMWLLQAEASFRRTRITSQRTMFDYVLEKTAGRHRHLHPRCPSGLLPKIYLGFVLQNRLLGLISVMKRVPLWVSCSLLRVGEDIVFFFFDSTKAFTGFPVRGASFAYRPL